MEDGTDESERFNEEEKDDSSGEDNSSSDVASLSCLPSFDYSERPPPYLEIEEIPSYRWLESHSSFARSEPDEISPQKSASSTSPSVASTSSHTSKRRNNPSSFRWNWWLSVRKERKASLTSLQEDTRSSDILTGIYQFTFEEIRTATNDFHNIIGKGRFTTTFKGFLPRHNQIAVKLFKSKIDLHPDVLRNAAYVSSHLRHRNITSFLGYCKHKDKFMLIYEYQPNGCLGRSLFSEGEGETLLNWRIRYKICLQTANGLAYLHKKRIIHRDIKPWNILLDADFVSKIDDFCLAKRMSEGITHLTTRVVGTIGYIDPEYFVQQSITEKTDVFSYGVLILNIVSGKRAFDITTPTQPQFHVDKLHQTLKEQGNLLEFVDPRLGSYDEEEALTLLKLSVLCTINPSSLRPSIHTVVSVLEGKLKFEELIYEPWQDDYEQEFSCFIEEETDDIETNDDVCTAPPTSEVKIMIPNKENVTQKNIEPLESFSSHDWIAFPDDDFDHLHVASGDLSYNTDDIDTLISVIDAIRIPEDPNGLGETPSSSSVPTAEVVVAFDELKSIVLRNNLREALDEETKSKILHLCEILDGLDISETQSGLVRRVRELLAFASEFSGIQEEDSLYKKMYESAKFKIEETKDKANKLNREAATLCASKTSAESDIDNIMNRKAKLHEELAKLHEELAKLDEELSAVKLRQVHDEKKLVEIQKILASDTREITLLAQSLATADKRIKNSKKCLEKAQDDWKQLHKTLKEQGNLLEFVDPRLCSAYSEEEALTDDA